MCVVIFFLRFFGSCCAWLCSLVRDRVRGGLLREETIQGDAERGGGDHNQFLAWIGHHLVCLNCLGMVAREYVRAGQRVTVQDLVDSRCHFHGGIPMVEGSIPDVVSIGRSRSEESLGSFPPGIDFNV